MPLALHCASAVFEISRLYQIMAPKDKRPRKGGGYLQVENAQKAAKGESLQQSALAKYMVPNFTASRCPTHKHKGMSLVKSLRAFMTFEIEVLWHFMALNASTKFRTYLI